METHYHAFNDTIGDVKLLSAHPVSVDVVPALAGRNRLTAVFRPILAIPHLLLVGGPAAIAVWAGVHADRGPGLDWGGVGVLGAVAGVCAMIAWFAILFGSSYPDGLYKLAVFYLRWRVRASAYLALLRDEYPPFGEGVYPAWLVLSAPPATRNRWSIAFRIFLAIPHLIAVWLLGVAWGVTTLVALISILFTGKFPPTLHRFGVGVLRWSTRVEAYLLLLHDDYPPFSLDA